MNKKLLIAILGIVAIGIIYFGIQMYGFADGVLKDSKRIKHNLSNPNLIQLRSEISPDKNLIFYEYQFDNGALGYSRIFWSVMKNSNSDINLHEGIIPNGYKIESWNENNELILKKWIPYYLEKNEILTQLDSEFKGVKLQIIE